MSTPLNWMEEASRLARTWSEQQQNFLRAVSGGANAMGMPAAAPGGVSFDAGLHQAQELWRASIEKWMALAPQGIPRGGNADEMLKALFDPGQWAEAGVGPLDRKVLKAQKLRAEWTRDLAAWQMQMQAAWGEAVKRFLAEVNDSTGAPIRSWRELTDLWVSIANDTLTATHRTPEFLEAQRRLTRSSTECRLQEREIAEAYCELNHIPTRTEIDELQHTVYGLRRELRALQKAARTTSKPAVVKAPAAKRARSRRTAPKA